MKRKAILLLGIGGVVVVVALGSQMMRLNYESPEHEVVLSEGAFEVRNYAKRTVAQTTLTENDWTRSTSAGFERLAGFIFGDNTGPSGAAEEIAMTSPVESSTRGTEHVVRFTMPSHLGIDTLPRPNDTEVTLHELPPVTVASLRFSGRATDLNLDAKTTHLLQLVAEHGYTAASQVLIAQYDPPWVVGPLRRNELQVDVTRR